MEGDGRDEIPRRVLVKLSGEVLAGSSGFGVDAEVLAELAGELGEVMADGTELALVVGGGNFFRGISSVAARMDRVAADRIGMLATVMNGLALGAALTAVGRRCAVMSAVAMPPLAEGYDRERARELLSSGAAVVFVAGTGNPLFTTDTAASLRAVEIGAGMLLKATKVDGVYTDDPVRNPEARRYDSITYDQVLRDGLEVMDATAIALCRQHKLPVRVFSMRKRGALLELVRGGHGGTLVH